MIDVECGRDHPTGSEPQIISMTRSKGRTSGCIGYETARRLGELGYRVWLGARDAQRGEAAAQALRDLGHDVRMIDIAVDDDARVKAAAARVTAEDGKLDVLIANAGLFTGSTETGRRVSRAAADNLVPVVLELGGKSPVILDASADLKQAAADIVAGKLLNAGQTCVAPDYVMLPRGCLAAFVEACRTAAARMRPDTAAADATAIIGAARKERLSRLIEGLNVVPLLPETAAGFMPCLVIDPPEDSALMREEIFGPVLPLIPTTS